MLNELRVAQQPVLGSLTQHIGRHKALVDAWVEPRWMGATQIGHHGRKGCLTGTDIPSGTLGIQIGQTL